MLKRLIILTIDGTINYFLIYAITGQSSMFKWHAGLIAVWLGFTLFFSVTIDKWFNFKIKCKRNLDVPTGSKFIVEFELHGCPYYIEEIEQDGSICLTPKLEMAMTFDTEAQMNDYMKNVRSAWKPQLILV